MSKRIAFDDAARASLRRGVDQLAGVVRVTLGPRGRHVVLERLGAAPALSNDGFAIAREIELSDRFENLGVQLLQQVAAKTAEVAGDGTTTAVVLAQALVGEGLRAVAAMQQGIVVDLDVRIALAAARISLDQKLPMADSVVLATARLYGAMLWTQDADFQGLPGVQYRKRRS